MSEPTRGALRLGFAVCLTALVVGPLHVPQPFLALLATQLLIGIPCPSAGVFFSRLASAAAHAKAASLSAALKSATHAAVADVTGLTAIYEAVLARALA